MIPESFRCLLVDRPRPMEDSQSGFAHIVELPTGRLSPGEVTIRVAYSSLNYKDALAYQGHRGVVKNFPHVPGIDAAGIVLDSAHPDVSAGAEVLVTGYELGQSSWGGWSELIRVPAAWVVPLPSGLTLREAMIYGTAGFTAAQAVLALQRNEVLPESGDVVVSGASGGVGSMAVRLLAHLGYAVVAVTGKPEQHAALIELGAQRVLTRDEIVDASPRPLLSAQWSGAVDTVGGKMLDSLLRSTRYGGCVAACGLVAGAELAMTVYPFLLRGISLCGIASADCPADKRWRIWQLLAGDWKPQNLNELVAEVELDELPLQIARILRGEMVGRTVARI